MAKKIRLYSDGSSLGNPGPGGWGTILEFNGHEKELSGGNPNTTNNQMELQGVIEGLKALKEPCAINEWLTNWIKNNWRTAGKQPVKNLELWKEYLEVSKLHTVQANWVKGHAGHPQNERCDILAKNEAERLRG